MTEIKRYYQRSDVAEVDIDQEREEELRTAYDRAEYGETIRQCVAVEFKADEKFNDSGIITASRLHADRIFELVSSMGDASETEDPGKITASATVIDVETDHKLSVHANAQHVFISLRDEDVPFQSFRDYVLFLEQSLHVTLTPELN